MKTKLNLEFLINKYTVAAIFALSLVVNALAGTTIIGGNTTAQVSDSYPNLFAPAGFTFAIWGIIYLLLVLFCVRLFVNREDQSEEISGLTQKLSKYFAVVTLLNTFWLFTWQYRILWLSALVIIAMLIALIKLTELTKSPRLSLIDWLSLKLPFSVYFGWITVATIANITTLLVSANWDGFGLKPETWAIVILIIGSIIGVITAFSRTDWAYMLVFIWAYFGIWSKHTSAEGYNGVYSSVVSLLQLILPIFAILFVLLAYKSYRQRSREII